MTIRLNANKPTKKNSGLPSFKNGTVKLMRCEDVITMPPVDDLGIACLGDFVLSEDAEFQYLYLTPKTQKYEINPTGDVDERLFRKKVSGGYPGNDLQIFEFIKNHINQGYIVIYKEDCEEYSKIFGSPENPLFLSPNYKSDSSGKGYEITLEQNSSDKTPVLFYNGEYPVIIKDDGIIEIIDIIGQPIEGPYKSHRIYLVDHEPVGDELGQFSFPVIFRICFGGKSFDVTYEKNGNRFVQKSADLPPGTNGQVYEIDNELPEKIKPTNRLTEVEMAAASALTTLSGVLEELADIEQNKANKDASAMSAANIISWQEALKINELQIDLQAQIDAEKTARENADIAEANARAFADGILQSNINAEASSRQNADDLKQDKSMFSALVDKWIHYYDSATQMMQPILKLVSGVVNQLEFSGRIKADAIVLPNNANPVVANRLRSDGSRLKYANNSAVEKDIAYVEDLSNGSSLVQRYLHTSNIVLVPTAVDYAAGTVTVPSHGLTIGTVYQAGGVPNSFANGSLENVDWACIPFEWTTNFCRLKAIDGNTIQILNNSSVLVTVNPASTDNNGKLDFTKWHMEIFSQLSINNFPIGIKSVQVRFFGMMVNATTDQAFRPHLYNSSGGVFTNVVASDQTFGSADRLRYHSGSVVGLALYNVTFDFTVYTGINQILVTGFSTLRSAGLNTFSFFGINSTNTSFTSKILKISDNIGLANLTNNTTSTIFNGSIIEIYKA